MDPTADSNAGRLVETELPPREADDPGKPNEPVDVMRQNYRPLDDWEQRQMAEVKKRGAAMHEYISCLGNSREVSLAKTKLEEAVMWATKHITG